MATSLTQNNKLIATIEPKSNRSVSNLNSNFRRTENRASEDKFNALLAPNNKNLKSGIDYKGDEKNSTVKLNDKPSDKNNVVEYKEKSKNIVKEKLSDSNNFLKKKNNSNSAASNSEQKQLRMKARIEDNDSIVANNNELEQRETEENILIIDDFLDIHMKESITDNGNYNEEDDSNNMLNTLSNNQELQYIPNNNDAVNPKNNLQQLSDAQNTEDVDKMTVAATSSDNYILAEGLLNQDTSVNDIDSNKEQGGVANIQEEKVLGEFSKDAASGEKMFERIALEERIVVAEKNQGVVNETLNTPELHNMQRSGMTEQENSLPAAENMQGSNRSISNEADLTNKLTQQQDVSSKNDLSNLVSEYEGLNIEIVDNVFRNKLGNENKNQTLTSDSTNMFFAEDEVIVESQRLINTQENKHVTEFNRDGLDDIDSLAESISAQESSNDFSDFDQDSGKNSNSKTAETIYHNGGEISTSADERQMNIDFSRRMMQKMESKLQPAGQLNISLKHAIISGKSEIKINLYPRALGAIEVTIEATENSNSGQNAVSKIKISAESRQSLELLEKSQAELAKALSEVEGSEDASLEFDMKDREESKQDAMHYSSEEERQQWMDKFVDSDEMTADNIDNESIEEPENSNVENNKSNNYYSLGNLNIEV